MAGIPMLTQRGQRTHVPVEVVRGGQVVEARTGPPAGIGVAGAGSTTVLGVAIEDAQPPTAVVTTATLDAGGRATLVAAQLPTVTTVVSAGTEVEVLYATGAAFGQKLVAAANGAVAPAGATPDARTIVGHCTAPAGVATGARGLMQTA